MEVYNPNIINPDDAGLQPRDYNDPYNEADKNVNVEAYASAERDDRICGLSRKAFFITLSIVITLLLAALLGVGLGVGLSHNGNRSSNVSISSVTTTVSVNPTPTGTQSTIATRTLAVASPSSTANRGGCPGANNSKWTSSSGVSTFQIYCSMNFYGNDLIGGWNVPMMNFDGCIEFCASLNDPRTSTLCYGVVWLGNSTTGAGGVCYPKNPAISPGAGTVSQTGTDMALIV